MTNPTGPHGGVIEPGAKAPLDTGTDPAVTLPPPLVKGPGAAPPKGKRKRGQRGKGLVHPELRAAAREYSHEALALYVRFLRNPKLKPMDRMYAADRILDRGHGKPKEIHEVHKFLDLSALNDEQLELVGKIYEALGLLPGGPGELARPAAAGRILDGVATPVVPAGAGEGRRDDR